MLVSRPLVLAKMPGGQGDLQMEYAVPQVQRFDHGLLASKRWFELSWIKRLSLGHIQEQSA